ncbi:MFS transporter [Mycobacterium paraffinicum]|uniref:MFS transporter n=1 Tax=Mycobacterium paraffinicum TaxID=53378 RepID=UPI000AC43DC3|nr:MFS transporter [Mycobacterium paraffinicum]
MRVPFAPDASTQTNPFWRLLSQGTIHTAGMQLSNGAVVLPFIAAHHGLTWAAAMLFPAYSIGSIVGHSLSPAALQRAGQMRHLLLAALAAASAALIVCDAAIAWTGLFASTVFVVVSAVGGVVVALSRVAYLDLISSRLSDFRRGELLLVKGAIGSVLATVVALVIVPLLARGSTMAYHRTLLWLGAAGLAASGIAALFLGPVRSISPTTQMSFRETYRQGFGVARCEPWFRRYVITSLLFAPVSLGATFYALRTAHQGGGLHVLVIVSSIGLVVGSPVWTRVHRVYGVRGMLVGSAILSAVAAAACILAELSGQWLRVWVYGTVFFLATLAGAAVVAAGISWISAAAAEQHRGTLIGFCSTLVAVVSTVLGAALGGIAQRHTAIWPVVVVFGLSAIAAIASLRAPQPGNAAKPYTCGYSKRWLVVSAAGFPRRWRCARPAATETADQAGREGDAGSPLRARPGVDRAEGAS